MGKQAVIVHLDGMVGVTPLVGGYLKAFALDDERVRTGWEIELYSQSSRAKASRVLGDLVQRAPDLIAFSVYTWNAGLVQRLLPALRGLLPPETCYLLGGVEVMNVAPRYVDPAWENVLVCNGEGEHSFRELLLELDAGEPDFSRVGGVTFARGGEWVTTAGQPRIEDLTEIPSPWLSGMFDGLEFGDVAFFETNRGCPFACEFCYWGGATGQKVYRQDLERIEEELVVMAKRGVRAISICDANFGIFPRDVEIAKKIVEVNEEHGGLNRVVFNSSKVRPDRVAEISRIFGEAGLYTRHVFSLQTLNEEALTLAKRTGLEWEPYCEIQHGLNADGRASIIELLWPMPGETLDSFQEGVDRLCRAGAQGLLIYPLVWLNNTGYEDNTERYGVATLPEDDLSSAGRIVVRTNEASFEEYLEGLRIILAVYLLHDCRGLYATMQLADALGVATFREVFAEFASWMDEEAQGPIAELWRGRLESFEDMAKYNWRGVVADQVLHGERLEFDRLLVEFVSSREWARGERGDLLRAALEYDLVCRPMMFLQTSSELGVELERLELLESRPRFRRVRSPYDFPNAITALRTGKELDETWLEPADRVLRIDHRTNQLFLMPSRSKDEHDWLCTLCVQEIAKLEPRCEVEPAESAVSG